MELMITPVTARRWEDLQDLFGAGGGSNGCWCMYWRIGPRYRERARNNNRGAELVRGQSSPGLIAYHEDLAVGWCELAPRRDLPWLDQARHLSPVDDLPLGGALLLREEALPQPRHLGPPGRCRRRARP